MTKCSFCNKSSSEVQKLIAGNNVFICDECIDICSDTIHNTGVISSTEPSFEIFDQQVFCAILQNYDERLIDQMHKWIEENIKDSWTRTYIEPNRLLPSYKIVFLNESDLVAFKLRWI